MSARFRTPPRSVFATAALAALAALVACNSATIVVGELQEITSMRTIPNRKLDLLFIIDNSPSMLEKQISLAQNFPRMIEALERLDGGLPDLHIGVITSDMGTLGSGSTTPGPDIGQPGNGGCSNRGDDGLLRVGSAPLAQPFISDVAASDGTRLRNYSGELRDVFSQIASVGQGGCGFEQHLASMRRAFTQPANAGFLRDDANLAIVIIADEDDCSLIDPALLGPDSAELGPLTSFRCTRFGVVCDPDDLEPGPKASCAPRASSPLVEDVQPFVDTLLALKPDPRMVMVAALVGDPTPFAIELVPPPGGSTPQLQLVHSCRYEDQVATQLADPAVRIAAFLAAFPGRSQLTSICTPDLSAPIAVLGGTAKKLVGDPCLDTAQLADGSPDPGIQPACQVVDIRDSAPAEPRDLPGCDSGAADCFEIAGDTTACPTAPDNLRVRFRRATPPADDSWTHVRCQVQL